MGKKAQAQVFGKMTSKLMYREYNVGKKVLSSLPRVYMDVYIDGKKEGRVLFELFADRAPRTAENFRALCTGERGVSPTSGVRLHYKGCSFFRAMNVDDLEPEHLMESSEAGARRFTIWKGMFVQGGDIVNNDGTGGESIYGGAFEDESFDTRHTTPGLLTMAGTPPMREKEAEEELWRPNQNRSQFAVTTKSRTEALGGRTILHWDGRHVVFGRVVDGMGVIHAVNNLPIEHTQGPLGHRIGADVVIGDCGQLRTEREEEEAAEDARMVEATKECGIIKAKREEAAKAPHVPVPQPRRPVPVPTAEDEAIRSAEVDDDDD